MANYIAESIAEQLGFEAGFKGMSYLRVVASISGSVDLTVTIDKEHVMLISVWPKGTTVPGQYTALPHNRFVDIQQGEIGDTLLEKFKAFIKRDLGKKWDCVDLLPRLRVFLISEGFDV